tara:strand:+ start:15992 stop:16435 length:444 start_codon:yes stop_codon:yes gene_type:complete
MPKPTKPSEGSGSGRRVLSQRRKSSERRQRADRRAEDTSARKRFQQILELEFPRFEKTLTETRGLIRAMEQESMFGMQQDEFKRFSAQLKSKSDRINELTTDLVRRVTSLKSDDERRIAKMSAWRKDAQTQIEILKKEVEAIKGPTK